MSYLRGFLRRLAAAGVGFNRHDGWLVAGGIAYYLALSLFPLLLVLVAILGWALEWTNSGQDARQQIMEFIQQQASPNLSQQIERALDSVSNQATAGGPIGFVLLVITALAIFAQIDYALDRIWEVKSHARKGWLRWLAGLLFARLRALGMLLAATLFIVVVMVASLTWARVLPTLTPTVVSVPLNICAFAVIYRFVPKPDIRWSEAIRGGLVAAVLWEVGRAALAAYLTHKSYPTAYGIIGSFMAVMLWAYYATIVVFYGAEYVRAIQMQSQGGGKHAADRAGPSAPAAPRVGAE